MQFYTYSSGDEVLVWREKILNIRIGKFIVSFTVVHHDERSKTVSIDQDRDIKGNSTSQIRPFLKQPSMLDDSITERKIKDQHVQTDNHPDEPEFDGDNVQLNVDQQSYGERSITYDSDSLT